MAASSPTREALGSVVGAHRQALGVTIEGLADQAGIHPTVYIRASGPGEAVRSSSKESWVHGLGTCRSASVTMP